MTEFIWIASPPEWHSALLSSGAGDGPMLASAATWRSLSTEYAVAAENLTTVVDTVQTKAWQGASVQDYVAAHTFYTAWLTTTSADYAEAAAAHETAAAEYAGALAAMPTLIELEANHAAHAVLSATNFFGINAVPLTLTEIDYMRMWLQAAAVMEIYAKASAAVSTALSSPAPAPMLLNAAASAAAAPVTAAGIIGVILTFIWGVIVALLSIIAYTIALFIAFLILCAAFLVALLSVATAFFVFIFIPFSVIFGILSFILGPPALTLGSAIALPISLPLGISRYSNDLQVVNTKTSWPEETVENPSPVLITEHRIAPAVSGFSGLTPDMLVAQPCGLTVLTDDGFSGGSHVPMVPASWDPH